MSGGRPDDGPPGADPREVVVDSRGRRCPLPVIDLARAVVDLPAGALVVLLTDDPAATTDVPAWCRMRGHDLLDAAEGDGVVTHRIRRR